jgi:dUTP pyrophosphatase
MNSFNEFRDKIMKYSGSNEHFTDFFCNELLHYRPQVLSRLCVKNPNFKKEKLSFGTLEYVKNEWGSDIYFDLPIPNDIIQVNVKRENETINFPVYKTVGAACADIESTENIVCEPNKVTKVKTGLFFEIPEGYKVVIYPRSGLTQKRILAQIGTIDSDYRGEVCVSIYNADFFDYQIQKGDRIAQISIEKISQISWNEVNELSTTDRGCGGFGSTGV